MLAQNMNVLKKANGEKRNKGIFLVFLKGKALGSCILFLAFLKFLNSLVLY
jgi:hypothetical protein